MEWQTEEERYKECIRLLKEIAKNQHTLFSKRFDWKSKTVKNQNVKRRIWSRKSISEKEYEQCLLSLENLKNALKVLCGLGEDASQWMWWNMPWSQVESYFIYDLLQEEQDGNWRYDRHWEVFGSGSQKTLVLKEEGHYTDFSSHTYEYERNESVFSQEEQERLVSDFNTELEKHRKREIWKDDGRPVKTDWNNIYASATDYFNSWEYKSDKDFFKDLYQRSLYTKHTTNIKTAVSQSKHYECLFEVGTFHVSRNKELDKLEWHPYELKICKGDIPDELEHKYDFCDAAIACAAFVHEQDWIEHISDKLFEELFMYKTNNEAEAIKFSKIITCLAGKLI